MGIFYAHHFPLLIGKKIAYPTLLISSPPIFMRQPYRAAIIGTV